MKVNVEFLSLQMITQALGKKKMEFDFKGNCFSDLLSELAQHVKKFKEMVLDQDGRLAYDIQVYINGDASVKRDDLGKRPMKEGDSVTFMFLLGGG